MSAAAPRGPLRRMLDGLYVGAAALAAAGIVLMFVLMLVQAVGREIGFQLRGAVDVVSWSNAATAFLGLAYAFRNADVIRITMLIDKLPATARRAAEILCLCIGVAFVGYAVYAAVDFVLGSWRMGEMTEGLFVIPIWIPQMSVVSGLAILLVAMLDDLVAVARRQTPSYELAAKARTASGEFGEEH